MAQKKILIVEDDNFISRAYQVGLQRAGFEVTIATNGEEALELLGNKEGRPDLILLDLVMPIKNGFETLEDLKLDNELKDIPVLILSNLGQDADIEKGKALGAVDYLVKSNYSMEQVIEKVKENLVASNK